MKLGSDMTVVNLKAIRHTLALVLRLVDVTLARHIDDAIGEIDQYVDALPVGGDTADECAACEARRARLWLERERCKKRMQ